MALTAVPATAMVMMDPATERPGIGSIPKNLDGCAQQIANERTEGRSILIGRLRHSDLCERSRFLHEGL